jgi:hypothetical protein
MANHPYNQRKLWAAVSLGLICLLATLSLQRAGFVPATAAPEQPPLYLDSTGGSNVLTPIAPTGSTAQFKDARAIERSAYKAIGTWFAAALTVSASLDALSDLHVWIGLVNSDDQGANFDLRAELLRNGSTIASGETKNILGVSRNPNAAKEVLVAFGPVSDRQFAPGDVLALKLWAKVADKGGHSRAVGLRAYYDAVTRPARVGALFGPANSPPVAIAGAHVNGLIQTPALLDGSDSHDPDGDRLTFHWTLVSAPDGSTAALASPWASETHVHARSARRLCVPARGQRWPGR